MDASGAAAAVKKRRGRPPKASKSNNSPAAVAAPNAGHAGHAAAPTSAVVQHAEGPEQPEHAGEQQHEQGKGDEGNTGQHNQHAQEHPGSCTGEAAEQDTQHDAQQPNSQQQEKPAKRRGRPPGVKNKNTLLKEGTAGPMMAHTLSIQPDEDVCIKLHELAQARNCSLTVLAASGTLSAATLIQNSEAPQDGGGGFDAPTVGVKLDGRFTILSISGAVLQAAHVPASGMQPDIASSSSSSAEGPQQFLSASLVSSAGGVVAGAVAGPLVAATPVLLVVGLFGQQQQQQAG